MSLGVSLREDVDRRTILRYEVLLRCCQLAAFRAFLASGFSSVLALRGYSVAYVGLRADATNAKIWQESKLIVTEVEGQFAPVALDDCTALAVTVAEETSMA